MSSSTQLYSFSGGSVVDDSVDKRRHITAIGARRLNTNNDGFRFARGEVSQALLQDSDVPWVMLSLAYGIACAIDYTLHCRTRDGGDDHRCTFGDDACTVIPAEVRVYALRGNEGVHICSNFSMTPKNQRAFRDFLAHRSMGAQRASLTIHACGYANTNTPGVRALHARGNMLFRADVYVCADSGCFHVCGDMCAHPGVRAGRDSRCCPFSGITLGGLNSKETWYDERRTSEKRAPKAAQRRAAGSAAAGGGAAGGAETRRRFVLPDKAKNSNARSRTNHTEFGIANTEKFLAIFTMFGAREFYRHEWLERVQQFLHVVCFGYERIPFERAIIKRADAAFEKKLAETAAATVEAAHGVRSRVCRLMKKKSVDTWVLEKENMLRSVYPSMAYLHFVTTVPEDRRETISTLLALQVLDVISRLARFIAIYHTFNPRDLFKWTAAAVAIIFEYHSNDRWDVTPPSPLVSVLMPSLAFVSSSSKSRTRRQRGVKAQFRVRSDDVKQNRTCVTETLRACMEHDLPMSTLAPLPFSFEEIAFGDRVVRPKEIIAHYLDLRHESVKGAGAGAGAG